MKKAESKIIYIDEIKKCLKDPYLIDMEGDSYRLRETLRSNGTDFETVVK